MQGNNATIKRNSATPFRILEVAPGGDLTLNDITVENGDADHGSAPPPDKFRKGRGGGIYNLGTLKVIKSTISHNNANAGGGIGNGDPQEVCDNQPSPCQPAGGTLTLLANSIVTGNKTPDVANNSSIVSVGGGIANGTKGTMNLTDCIVSDNKSAGDAGIASQGAATLTNCYVIDNVAKGNFGGIVSSGSMTITNSFIVGNRAKGANGDSGEVGGIANLGSMTVTSSNIIDNVAEHDAGGVGNTGSLTMSDSHIIGNHAENVGGGISNNFGGNAILTGNHIIHNKANADGGGIFNGIATGSTVTLIGSNTVRDNALHDCTNVTPPCP
jgi:hypothetical protein